jgi:transposase
MYLRPHRKIRDGTVYEYWSLVRTVRTARGPRQRVVAFIGKEPGLDAESRAGWEHMAEVLDGRERPGDLFAGPRPEPPQWATVDIKRVRVERLRQFGNVYLGLALWRRLGLGEVLERVLPPGRESVPWPTMACILTMARFCDPSSELKIGEQWYAQTALDDILGVPMERVNEDRLYRALDALLPAREALFHHLQKRYTQWFGSTFDILLYDITSTYFEGRMRRNPQAKRGYSRDGRPDCLQLCIGLIVTPDGLPVAYEVFDGNRTDVTTVEEVIETLRRKYGHERRIWVMDRGMVSEEILAQLRGWGACYLVGTPKSMLRQFETHLLDERQWSRLVNGVEVKLCQAPDGSHEQFVLCRAPGRREKERAMRQRQLSRMVAELEALQRAVRRPLRPLRQRPVVDQRIGRILQRYPRAARLIDIQVVEQPALDLAWQIRGEDADWADLADGAYLLRTNLTDADPQSLWETYIHLTQVEFSFRVSKTDLAIRPVYHHTAPRAQAHILVCFLALVLWRTLEKWMSASGLGNAPRLLIEELAQVQSMDVVLPTRTGRDLRLRLVSRPEARLALLLDRLHLSLPSQPLRMENVVTKTAS